MFEYKNKGPCTFLATLFLCNVIQVSCVEVKFDFPIWDLPYSFIRLASMKNIFLFSHDTSIKASLDIKLCVVLTGAVQHPQVLSLNAS